MNKLIIGAAICCSLFHACTGKKDKPNILFIMSDDHTSQGIGAYDDPRFRKLNITPTIDRLAEEGMLFENVFCTNSICTPSRATILTGQYNHTNEVRDLYDPLPPERQYLSVELKKAGYQTAVVGKWHLRESPESFDYYNVLPGQGKYHNPVLYSRDKGEIKDVRIDSRLTRKLRVKEHQGHSSDVITDITLDWLKNKRNKDEPFFLMHHFKAPHDMFENAERYNDYLENVDFPMPETGYEPDSKNNWIINNTDFAPTILELAGLQEPLYMQGDSFVKALKGEKKPDDWRRAHYYRYWMHMAHNHNNPAHFGIRTDRYKLIFFYGTDFIKTGDEKNDGNRFRADTPVAWELYDLKKDPNETVNIYEKMKGSEVVRELKSLLSEVRNEIGDTDEEYPHIKKIINSNWE